MQLQQIETHVKSVLKLPTEDSAFIRHISNILSEEPPISGAEIFELIADFFELFQISRAEAIKKCDVLYNALKGIKGYLKN